MAQLCGKGQREHERHPKHQELITAYNTERDSKVKEEYNFQGKYVRMAELFASAFSHTGSCSQSSPLCVSLAKVTRSEQD